MAVKTLLASGHEVVCFERSSEIGGLWNYETNGHENGQPGDCYVELPENKDTPMHSRYSSLTFNTLSFAGHFSDFLPFSQEELDQMKPYQTPGEYFKYLKKYVNHFGLLKCVKFGRQVVELRKSLTPPGWIVVSQNDQGNSDEEHFDFVFIASGDGSYPNIPEYPNEKSFKGLMIHSCQVRNEEQLFRGKRVLIVGGRFSASDMVVAAVRNEADHVYWAMSKHSMVKYGCIDKFPVVNEHRKVPWQGLITRFNYEQNGKNVMRLMNNLVTPLTNDSDSIKGFFLNNSKFLQSAISKGDISFVSSISSFSEDGAMVNLIDNSSLEVDVIILATGFLTQFPFLNKIWPSKDQNASYWYNHVICPKPDLDGLAFIGMIRGPFSVPTVTEMQCWWLCKTMVSRQYQEDGSLYDSQERSMMEKSISEMKSIKVIVDVFRYLDNLADAVNLHVPEFNQLKKVGGTELAVAVYHGPLTGCHYLLEDTTNPHFETCKNYLIYTAKIILGGEFGILVVKYEDNQS